MARLVIGAIVGGLLAFGLALVVDVLLMGWTTGTDLLAVEPAWGVWVRSAVFVVLLLAGIAVGVMRARVRAHTS
jgi:hypothetical protein